MEDTGNVDAVKKRMSEPFGLLVPRPVNSPITAEFGRVNLDLWDGPHRGTDFGCPVGTSVKNCFDGIVQISKDEPLDRLGKRVWILSRLDEESGSWLFRCGYCHLEQINFTWGQTVRAGEIIGLSGKSGRSKSGGEYKPHLHHQMEWWPTRDLIKPEFVPA